MDKALGTKPEYNLGSLFCPALVTRPEEHKGRITDTCLFLLLLYYKITIPKDWSLNSHLLNLVLTEIRKNPSSTVYGNKAQLIWKPFPCPYSAAREDPSISVQSHHCWSWQPFDRTIGRLQFKEKGQVTGWNALFKHFPQDSRDADLSPSLWWKIISPVSCWKWGQQHIVSF